MIAGPVKQSTQNSSLYNVLKSNPEKLATNDALLRELLISKRPAINHLLYDEVMVLMHKMGSEFSNIMKVESIGKTYDNRDIFMLKIDATDYFKQHGIDTIKDKKALLMTGAHHSRELVSVQMPLYTILDILHGVVHQDKDTLNMLQRNQVWTIPMVNVDGSFTIFD